MPMTNKQKIVLDLLLIVIAVMALTLPFLNQAIHLDDEEFISFARVQLEDPLRFYLTDHSHNGHHYDIFRTTHPPMMSSYYATLIWLAGGEYEVVFHAANLIFPLLAALSMYALSRRFCRHPLAASMLLVVSSGFVVMSHNLRGDLPGMAFWVASVAAYAWGLDRSDWKLLSLSGLAMAFAVMTAYQGLALIPLLFIYAVLNKRVGLKAMLPLAVPAFTFLAYFLHVRDATGGTPQFSYNLGIRFGWENLDSKLRAVISYLGGMIIFPLALIPAAVREATDFAMSLVVMLTALVLGVAIPLMSGSLTVLQAAILTPMLAAGAAVLYRCVMDIVRGVPLPWQRPAEQRDAWFLALWLAGIVAYVYVLMPYVSVRYLLPLFPPVILIFMRGAEKLFAGRPGRLYTLTAITLVLGLAISIPASVADYRLAGTFRDMAKRFSRQYADNKDDVWFFGEFGMRYYMEREGFRYLVTDAVAKPGDLVIRSEEAAGIPPNVILYPPPPEITDVVELITLEDEFPVRIRNPWAGAGFYSHRGGPVPIMPSGARIDHYTVYKLDF